MSVSQKIHVFILTTTWLSIFHNVHCLAKSKTILITGGGGYIGSHTTLEILNSNYSVVVLDNLSNCYAYNTTEKPESLKRVDKLTNKHVIFYNVDIRDAEALDKLFKTHSIDAVIHFAALKSVGESVKKPLEYYNNNVAGTNNLLQVMQKNNVKNIIYSSSATVYGNPQFLPLTEDHTTGVNISNPYGKSKYFTEEIMKDISRADSKWKIILLRYFNPVGAHPSGLIGEDPSGIPNNLMPYISQVAVGRRDYLNIFGSDYPTPDGTGIRDYIHIQDLAVSHLRSLSKILDHDWNGWKAFNLGTGAGYSVLELVKAFERNSGRRVNYKFTNRRDGDVPSVYADPSLAKKELNWTAERDIDDMCKDTWNWQRQNPNGYQEITDKPSQK